MSKPVSIDVQDRRPSLTVTRQAKTVDVLSGSGPQGPAGQGVAVVSNSYNEQEFSIEGVPYTRPHINWADARVQEENIFLTTPQDRSTAVLPHSVAGQAFSKTRIRSDGYISFSSQTFDDSSVGSFHMWIQSPEGGAGSFPGLPEQSIPMVFRNPDSSLENSPSMLFVDSDSDLCRYTCDIVSMWSDQEDGVGFEDAIRKHLGRYTQRPQAITKKIDLQLMSLISSLSTSFSAGIDGGTY